MYFNGKVTNLNCNLRQANQDVLICRMAKGVPGIGGKVVSVEVNGFGFAPYVEVKADCQPVYDYLLPPDEDTWEYIGTYCQNTPIESGVGYTFYNPTWDDYYEYYLGPGGFCGPGGSYNNFGKGLYYSYCAN